MGSIMETLWDESSELNAEGMNERSIVSDDYTTDDSMEIPDKELDSLRDMDKVIDPEAIKKQDTAQKANK